MNIRIWLGGILASLLTACSPSVQNEKAEGQIDVLPAFENLTELKVSIWARLSGMSRWKRRIHRWWSVYK